MMKKEMITGVSMMKEMYNMKEVYNYMKDVYNMKEVYNYMKVMMMM